MVRAILFDLDGTLLDVNMDVFLKKYFQTLVSFMNNYMSGDIFLKKLLAATEAMIQDKNAKKTNRDIFFAHFFADSDFTPQELMPVFDRFYREEFDQLSKYTEVKAGAWELIQSSQDLGFDTVIATNPVFPEIAIRKRLKWAGIDSFTYSLVTSYEHMHFCKPWIEYYEEILHKLGRKPEECLMVGNDMEDDMVAGKMGIVTFLNDDTVVCKNDNPITPDYRGSLEDVKNMLYSLRERREAKGSEG